MVDATLPTVAFVVANSLAGLTVGIWAALAAAVLVFGLRLVRRQSVQQGISGLFAVAVAVAIAWKTGEARDFFTLGLIRNAGIGVVLLGSIAFRWPLVGVVAEFLAPSHLGAMASHSLPSLRALRAGRGTAAATPVEPVEPVPPATGGAERVPDAVAEQHWRDDPRLVRAYSWLTVLWASVFLLRAGLTWFFYVRDDVEMLGAVSVTLGLPVTAVQLVITLWVVARLHRHRTAEGPRPPHPSQARGEPLDGA
ncbi:DUF3159 domain-containing protein [Modestobacter lapidis]|nr:DUF3159 domain-containing protein [Modestobacter lapidis]